MKNNSKLYWTTGITANNTNINIDIGSTDVFNKELPYYHQYISDSTGDSSTSYHTNTNIKDVVVLNLKEGDIVLDVNEVMDAYLLSCKYKEIILLSNTYPLIKSLWKKLCFAMKLYS